MILTGDLNVAHLDIDIFDPKGKDKIACFTPEERKSFGDFLGKGWIDTFRNLYPDKKQFSFWSMRSGAREKDNGWRLDYFLISKQDVGIVVDSSIHKEYNGSDHCPIELTIKLPEQAKATAGKKSKKIVEETKEEAIVSKKSKKRAIEESEEEEEEEK